MTVFARPEKSAPGSRPYQRNRPVVLLAPSQVFLTTAASVMVIGPHGVEAPTRLAGSKPHLLGTPITPSTTPSPSLSQAATAAELNAAHLHCGRKSPDPSMTN